MGGSLLLGPVAAVYWLSPVPAFAAASIFVLGGVYLVGRALYFVGYVRDPARREIGFALSALPIVVLLVGAVIGVVVELVGR